MVNNTPNTKDLKRPIRHREIWGKKEILRLIYSHWYKLIADNLANQHRGITVEVGAGSGNMKGYYPEFFATDIVFCPWLDLCFDAHHLPFKKGTINNIIVFDVLHHLDNPLWFLTRAAEVLHNKGRIVIFEPYCSLFSGIVYKLFHPANFSKVRITAYN